MAVKMNVFQANEIAGLVGMPERRLSKFVESPGYGIKPSIRLKAGKGAPRLYSAADAFSIALAWWLFQSGFRSKVIGRVLKSKDVASIIRESERFTEKDAANRFLIVMREMSANEPPAQQVLTTDLNGVAKAIEKSGMQGFQVLPIGSLMFGVWKKLR